MRDLRGAAIRRAAVAGLVIATALLTGCTEKTEANDTLPTTSASPTTESLPELGPPDFPVPDEARTKDAAGAEAFLRYWIELINRQRAIPAGQPLRDLGPQCDTCLRYARVFDDAAANGRHFEGGELSVASTVPAALDGETAQMSFRASQEALSLVDEAGATVESLPADSALGSGISLTWAEPEQGWFVSAFDVG